MSSKEQTCFVCTCVFNNEKPVLLVSFEDGDWQFLCGDNHKPSEKPKVVGINHILERDITLKEVLKMGNNKIAERKDLKDQWQVSAIC